MKWSKQLHVPTGLFNEDREVEVNDLDSPHKGRLLFSGYTLLNGDINLYIRFEEIDDNITEEQDGTA